MRKSERIAKQSKQGAGAGHRKRTMASESRRPAWKQLKLAEAAAHAAYQKDAGRINLDFHREIEAAHKAMNDAVRAASRKRREVLLAAAQARNAALAEPAARLRKALAAARAEFEGGGSAASAAEAPTDGPVDLNDPRQ